MRFFADLHLHSRFSRATSRDLTVENIARWCRLKGIDLVGTGDFTHPIWLNELKGQLQEAEEGLYQAKGEPKVRWMLTVELSCIYRQDGRSRRNHLLVTAPSFDIVDQLNAALQRYGNLTSDGRPIFGLTSRDLTDTILSISSDCLVIPAHIWTPWFSTYGSKSGYESLGECFGDLLPSIYAVETGLSSDPAMNWRVEELDTRRIVSFSDAHSPAKLAREGTFFDGECSYPGVVQAIRGEGPTRVVGTVEFFPQEGKYHYDGHRTCKFVQAPEETKRRGSQCPVCKSPLTVGVLNRVETLATRPCEALNIVRDGVWVRSPDLDRPPYCCLVPLHEVIAASLGVKSIQSKRVQALYERLVAEHSELDLLLDVPIGDIEAVANPRTAEGITRVREGRLQIDPGYDGVYGEIRLFTEDEGGTESSSDQMGLFSG